MSTVLLSSILNDLGVFNQVNHPEETHKGTTIAWEIQPLPNLASIFLHLVLERQLCLARPVTAIFEEPCSVKETAPH